MTAETSIYAGGLILLLVVSGFCSGSEAVFFSQSPLDLRRMMQRHPATGKRVHALLAAPTRLLSAILILNTIVNVSAAAVCYRLFLLLRLPAAEMTSALVITVLLLVFGEYGPKRLALLLPGPGARISAPVWPALILLVSPLRWLLEHITRAFEPFLRVRPQNLNGEELKTVLDLSGQEGIIDAEEFSLIKAIISLETLKASDVMTPRVDLVGLDLESDPDTFLPQARAARRKYLLLYRGRMDDVAGLLDVRRFLLDPQHRVDAATVPPMYVPESVPLNRLLGRLQKSRQRVAVVVDEYGGTAGVITRGAILERISGEIYHELSRPRPVFQEAGPYRWLVDANFSLEELNHKLRLRLSAEGADRLAGWITSHAGGLPAEGETLDAQGVRITVLKVEQKRVTLAQIEKREDADE